MPSLSSVLVQCGLLASYAQIVYASEFSGATEVRKLLATNEYTLLACKSNERRLFRNDGY
jgi:protein disulfide-isomerase A1